MESTLTVADLYRDLSQYRSQLAWFLLAFPLLGPALGAGLARVHPRLGAWWLSLVVHLGTFLLAPSALVFLYQAVILRENLMVQLDLILVVGPMLSGFFALLLSHKVLSLDEIPGFDRIFSLFFLAALCSTMVFVLSRTIFFAGLLFRPTMGQLVLATLGLYLVVRNLFGRALGGGGKVLEARSKPSEPEPASPQPSPEEVDASVEELQAKIRKEKDSGHGEVGYG